VSVGLVFTYGSFRVDDPLGWVVGCTFLWIIFLPLYIAGRRN
jgi:hypothetical protein